MNISIKGCTIYGHLHDRTAGDVSQGFLTESMWEFEQSEPVMLWAA